MWRCAIGPLPRMIKDDAFRNSAGSVPFWASHIDSSEDLMGSFNFECAVRHPFKSRSSILEDATDAAPNPFPQISDNS